MVSKNFKSIKGKDGKEMVLIPGGEFLFGPEQGGAHPAGLLHRPHSGDQCRVQTFRG